MSSKLVDIRLGGIPRYYLTPRGDIDMRVPDEVRQCVVFVALRETTTDGMGDQWRFIGTAFFVAIPSETIPHIVYVGLVTAKHIAERTEGRLWGIRANTQDGGSIPILASENTRWWYHPTDDNVDAAFIPWVPPEQVEYKQIPRDMFLTDETIRSRNIGTGDEVFITGLFAHLTGSARNIPIVRMGNIAMMPTEPVPTSIGPIDAYLIEARSIGGLSGSPAFVRETILGIGPFHLMGLMHGHWDIPPENKDDALGAGDSIGLVNMGIAIVIPAKKILEVINRTELVEMRKRADEQRRKETMPTLDEATGQEEEGLTEKEFGDVLKKVSRRITPSEPDQAGSGTSA